MGLSMHSIDRSMKRKYFALSMFMFALAITLASCAPTPASTVPVVTSINTPVSARAGGEPILPYSQILLHNAPLPLATDYSVDSHNWTLAGYDTSATRDVTMPDCCSASPAPLWFQSLGTPLLTSPLESNGL